MSNEKNCIDCDNAWWAERIIGKTFYESTMSMPRCRKFKDIVTGIIIWCEDARLNEKYCGIEGKCFEKR